MARVKRFVRSQGNGGGRNLNRGVTISFLEKITFGQILEVSHVVTGGKMSQTDGMAHAGVMWIL